MSRNNIPLNIQDKRKSQISLIASIIVLILLCVILHAIDIQFA